MVSDSTSRREALVEQPRRTRERSTSYPLSDLATAIKDVGQIYSHGKTMHREALARSLGYTSATTGLATRRLAALSHYGLVDYDKGQAVITDVAKRYFAPVSDAEASSALREAFLAVGPFRALCERITPGAESRKEVLGNIAERELGIATKAKKDFLETFVKSGVFAGLVEEVGETGLRLRDVAEMPRLMPLYSAPAQEGKIIEGEMRILPPREVASGIALTIQLAIDSSMSAERLEELLGVLKRQLGL